MFFTNSLNRNYGSSSQIHLGKKQSRKFRYHILILLNKIKKKLLQHTMHAEQGNYSLALCVPCRPIMPHNIMLSVVFTSDTNSH